MQMPECPRCDYAAPLDKIRADGKGLVWGFCNCCSATVLVSADGRVLHASVKEGVRLVGTPDIAAGVSTVAARDTTA